MSLLCRIGFHKYQRAQNEDGMAYLVCGRCRKESFPDGAVGAAGSNLAM